MGTISLQPDVRLGTSPETNPPLEPKWPDRFDHPRPWSSASGRSSTFSARLASSREQDEPAVLRARLDRHHPARRPDQSGGEQGVKPDIGADVDDGHAGPAEPLEHRDEVRLVVTGQYRARHRTVLAVQEQRDPVLEPVRDDVVRPEAHGDRRREELPIEGAQDLPEAVQVDDGLADQGVGRCMEVRRLPRGVEHREGGIECERIGRGPVGLAGRLHHAAEAGDDLVAEASGEGAGRTGIRARLRHGPKATSRRSDLDDRCARDESDPDQAQISIT